MTASSIETHLIKATRRVFVQGHGIIKPVQVLSAAQLESLDRLEGTETPEDIAAFLIQRSLDVHTRFSGHIRMGRTLVGARKLKRFEAAAEAAFLEVGPSLFKADGQAAGGRAVTS